jgi:transposase
MCASIIPNTLRSDTITLTALKTFGIRPNAHLRRFNGIKKEHFYWFLKECEWRFNSKDHKSLLFQLKYWYKSAKY